ncbi:DUF1183-domain-containing protein [Pholiota conissans]|uniref:Store-operated calcium entry-associated regulatory factor n=1 Tax=Pholiota conissans TaxID=109636 RepID=A0A9P5YRN5_9AGAR|nr:DUF1183-domain-containing protein [Pholiota conissans]
MSRIELAKIPSLTFYKGEYTAARRTEALSQLVCVGKPCKLYQPDVVRCVNIGGNGVDVDWRCEADLPSALRFGKVEVSCEGWARPGDPYVLKGSCSLEYRLVEVPKALRDSDSPLFGTKSYDWGGIAFSILWIGLLLFIVYSFVQSCLRNNAAPRAPRPAGNNYGPGGGGSGFFPGGYRDDAPPPPYSKTQQDSAAGSGWGAWRPGFWTGAALGGIANHYFNRAQGQYATPRAYDWERRAPPPARTSPFGGGSSGYRRQTSDDDRGEGSSNLGATRRSTGLGGSRVR